MSAARVVAVVLNWCAEEDTVACVRSLSAQQGVCITPLIVDNGSPDGSGDRLARRFPECPFLETGENLGYAGGNARGIAWALEQNPEYVFVINDDAEVEPGCVATLVAALDASPDAGAASPTIVHAASRDLVWWAGGRFDPLRALSVHEGLGRALDELPARSRAGAEPRDVSALSGCAILLRASVVRTLGSFREDFFAYVEDTELSVRWRSAGRRLLHVPSALAVHKVAYPEPEPTAFRIRLRDRNRRRLARLHLRALERLRFSMWFAASRFVLAASYALRGDGARLRALARGAFER
jgi:GT2 family glycosyltransferase